MDRNGSGESESNRPPEWDLKEYEPLRAIVASQIAELARKLVVVKRMEEVPRWEGRKKSGQLNPATLYRARIDTKLFRRKLPQLENIADHAFSLLVDTSGSMAEQGRMYNAKLSAIILAEVLGKLSIPYELIGFDDTPTFLKKFEEPLTPKNKKLLAGMRADNGTNLDRACEATKIGRQARKTKVVVIISDGGVSRYNWYEEKFAEWKKHNIKVLGIGINSGEEIAELCGEENSKNINDPNELPRVFIDLLTQILKQR